MKKLLFLSLLFFVSCTRYVIVPTQTKEILTEKSYDTHAPSSDNKLLAYPAYLMYCQKCGKHLNMNIAFHNDDINGLCGDCRNHSAQGKIKLQSIDTKYDSLNNIGRVPLPNIIFKSGNSIPLPDSPNYGNTFIFNKDNIHMAHPANEKDHRCSKCKGFLIGLCHIEKDGSVIHEICRDISPSTSINIQSAFGKHILEPMQPPKGCAFAIWNGYTPYSIKEDSVIHSGEIPIIKQ